MRYLQILAVAIFFISCSKSVAVVEIKDKDLLIQATCQEGSSAEPDLEYKVRIYPELKYGESVDKKVNEQMAYQIDSCFYKIRGVEKEFPETVIPIPNGIKNCFEYLIVFPGKANDKEPNELLYDSKYINATTYKLIFK
ncbi:hypothetical protein [Pedobacter nyackensis]|uniref:hypothetical protein n=1 Tax=Pedobacter nyackensis TaxID=475255 RepID=UPI00292ECD52|nr:hypothetical protein [Pedobacter nyackensis]